MARIGRIVLPLVLAVLTTGAIIGGVERGNRLFRAGEYAEAAAVYRAALEDGTDTPVLRYNLGTALLKLGDYAAAEEHLRAALDGVDPSTRQWAYYNLGLRYLEDARRSEDPQATGALYDAAVDAYRQALRLAPDDADAKWNYELALREREQQQSGGGGGGEQPQEPEPQPGDQGGGGEAQGRNQPSDQPRPAREGGAQAPLTQEQAERILSAVEQDERELFRDKLKRGQRATRTERDW